MTEMNFKFYKIKSKPVKKTIAIDSARLKDLKYKARYQEKVGHKLNDEGKEDDDNESLQDKRDKTKKSCLEAAKETL